MGKQQKKLLLNAFHMCSPSQQWAGMWTHERDQGLNYHSLDYYVELARTAERGLLDGIFFADSIGLMDKYGGDSAEAIRAGAMAPMNDPTLAISAMALVTEHLGFGVTANLTFEHPFIMARRFSTLDHLTKGRIGWNIVAGFVDSGARAIGEDRLRAPLRLRLFHLLDDARHRHVPGDRLEAAVALPPLANARAENAVGPVDALVELPHLGADEAVGDRVALRAVDGEHLAVLHRHGEAAGIGTVERTRSVDDRDGTVELDVAAARRLHGSGHVVGIIA